MLTLKIRMSTWHREGDGPAGPGDGNDPLHLDETFLFVEAESVRVNTIGGPDRGDAGQVIDAWERDGTPLVDMRSYTNVDDGTHGMREFMPSKLIEVVLAGTASWYLVTHAWLLGPSGQTIERIAP